MDSKYLKSQTDFTESCIVLNFLMMIRYLWHFHGILQARILEWVAVPFSSPGDLPNPGMEPDLLHCRRILYQLSHKGSPEVKNPPANAQDARDSIFGSGGRHGNPLQYSGLENPHGQRSLAGYSPWGHKKSDVTEAKQTSEHYFCT